MQVIASPQPFSLDTDRVTAKGSGNITMGRADGLFPLILAQAADASYTKSEINVTSLAFSATLGGGITKPLWGGSVKIDVTQQKGQITDNGAAGMFQMAGLDVDFKTVTFLTSRLAFDVDFKLPDDLGGVDVNTVGIFKNALIIDGAGARFAPPGAKLSLPNDVLAVQLGPIKAKVDDPSLEYKSSEDALFMRGKLVLEDVQKGEGGSRTTVEADFTDTNYIRLRSDGKIDVVGAVHIKDFPRIGGWQVKDVSLSLDTTKNIVTASGTVSTPVGLRFGDGGVSGRLDLQFTYDPFHFDGFFVQADNLNKPIPFFPEFFFQSIGGGVTGWSPSS
jgi:hypothetical protein